MLRLDSTNIAEYSLKWQKAKGLDPTDNPSHSEYLTELATNFESSLMQMIADTADLLEVESGSPVYQEVLCHGKYCKDQAKSFMVFHFCHDCVSRTLTHKFCTLCTDTLTVATCK